MGSKINFYNPCVANKMINGKQMTIVWYLNDLKISHIDAKEVTKMCKNLEKLHNKVILYRGKEHGYLGINLHFKENGALEMSVIPYINASI